MQITAAVKRADSEEFQLGSIEIDVLRDNEVLVRIAGVGRCHGGLMLMRFRLSEAEHTRIRRELDNRAEL